jgi:fermentation-respiration switch protein FrsA (DUF1100 family)
MRFLVALALLVAAFFGLRLYAGKRLEHDMVSVHKQGPRTPAARGLVFEDLPLILPDRTLRAFYVPADGPGLLIFHGNGESISGWVDALKILHDGGLAAMVFDYSGFGNSTGEPTLANFHGDALEAWRVFRTRLPAATRACAYGLSLGSAVLLEAAPEIHPDCVAVSGAFLSAREAAVQLHRLARWQAWILPDALDSLDNVARFGGPLLIEHGSDDEKFPPSWAQTLAKAHPGAQVEIVKGMRHGDPVAHPSAAAWDPVIRFVKSETTARR